MWAFGKGEDGRLGLDDEDPRKTFFRRCHIGSVGLANAKADHDESQTEHRQVLEWTLKEKKELNSLVFFGPPKRRLQPLREEYESGVVVFVGKDVEAVVGMRLHMKDGLISHGVGTITCLGM